MQVGSGILVHPTEGTTGTQPTMAKFCVKSVTMLDNQSIKSLDGSAPFTDYMRFCVDFECDTDLQHNVIWRVWYMNADETGDQQLYTESMAVSKGTCMFTLKSPPPDLACIPTPDVIGPCVIKLTCTYADTEFFGIGYFCNITCSNEALTCETMTDDTRPDISTLTRVMLLGESRETLMLCHFDSPPPAQAAEGDDNEAAGDQEAEASDHSSMMDDEEEEASDHSSMIDDEEEEASDVKI